MAEEVQPKTLYVGNLHPSVTEELILALFNQIGPVKGCKIIRETAGGDPYCFVEFSNHTAASTALVAMNHRTFLDKQLKVNWAASPGGIVTGMGGGGGGGGLGAGAGAGAAVVPSPAQHQASRPDTSQHHHIFVGDLSPEIETEVLRDAFAPFGDISDCRVVKDLASNKSKGYGFVSFLRKNDAQTAIEQMNGQWLGSRAIRTNWATRKPPGFGGGGGTGRNDALGGGAREIRPLNYDVVFSQASAANCTVYCGGLLNGDDDLIRRTFSPFGRIMEVRYFRDKGYAFIRYDNKESACNAIVAVHGTEVNNSTVKCSWGKENGGHPQHQQQYGQGGGGGADNCGFGPPQVGGGGGRYMAAAVAPPPQALQQQFYQQQQFLYNPQLAQMPLQQFGYTPTFGYTGAYDQGYAQQPPQ